MAIPLGRAIAVVAGGLNVPSPPEHADLQRRIAAAGAVVTEAPPSRLAVEAGREVFAVPGSPLDPRARGANDLIRQGAALVETAADVLANLPDHSAAEAAPLFARSDTPDGAAGFSEPHPLDGDLRDSPLDHTALYA